MKNVIKTSALWLAVAVTGAALTGCGGSSSGSSSQSSSAGAVGGSKALLTWTAPATRLNGEGLAMGELEKYVIRYGQDSGNLSEEVVVDGAAEDASMSYTVGGLDQGTWFFTIQVQDTDGLMSPPSDVVSKSIQS